MKQLTALVVIGCIALGVNAHTQSLISNRPDSGAAQAPRDLTVANVERLHKGTAWDIHPNGKTVLFSGNENPADNTINDITAPADQLHALDLATRSVKEISQSESQQGNARYSPDGKMIAFTENSQEMFSTFLLDNSATAVKQRIPEEAGLTLPQLAWSPDGNYIAGTHSSKDTAQIIVYNSQGIKKQTLTDAAVKVRLSPYFYDNETLLYIAGATGEKGGFWLAAEKLVDNSVRKIADCFSFAVSPDKTMLAYVSRQTDEGQNSDILRINVLQRDLTLGPDVAEIKTGNDIQPAWSPDSKQLLYVKDDSLWVFSTETGNSKQLVSQLADIVTFFWVADNKIIFSAIDSQSVAKGDHAVYTYLVTLTPEKSP